MTSLLNPDPAALPRPGRDELAAWLRLSLTHGVGPATTLTLLSAFGSPRAILGATHAEVSRVAGAALATRLVKPDPDIDAAVEHTLDWAEEPGHALLTLADPCYPRTLLDIADPPPLLYVSGHFNALQRPALAIVGSRHASVSGNQTARAFAAHLAGQGLTIVSGLARGIDTAAHQGALSVNGLTLAVLGTGLDRVYPAANRTLADGVQAHGALITELPLGTGPQRANFPRRNRLIAGLTGGVLVVEAARRSGSLITARLAAESGREVFAIPGSIHSPLARGCHQLIRDGARLVESADDILSELRPDFLRDAARFRPIPIIGRLAESGDHTQVKAIPDAAAQLLEQLGWDPVSYDSLTHTMPADAGTIDEMLLILELAGYLERLPDGRLRRLPG